MVRLRSKSVLHCTAPGSRPMPPSHMAHEIRWTDEPGYEARWTAWVAKGLEQDKAMRSRALGVTVAVAIGLVLWLVGLVALG